MLGRAKILAAGLVVAAATTALSACDGSRHGDADAPIVRPLTTASGTHTDTDTGGNADNGAGSGNDDNAPNGSNGANGDSGGRGDSGGTTVEDPFVHLTAPQVLRRAEAAMRAAPSLTVRMDGKDSGTALHVRAVLTRAGRCAAAIRTGRDDLQLIGIGRTYYMKAGLSYWRSSGAPQVRELAPVLARKWLKLPSSAVRESDFGDLCDLRALLDNLAADDAEAPVVKGRLTTLDGRPVLPLTQQEDGDTSTIYVAATGKPYIVRTITPIDDLPDAVTYSDFGRIPRISAPPAELTLDLSRLGLPRDFSI